jgi:hypothetical protein
MMGAEVVKCLQTFDISLTLAYSCDIWKELDIIHASVSGQSGQLMKLNYRMSQLKMSAWQLSDK